MSKYLYTERGFVKPEREQPNTMSYCGGESNENYQYYLSVYRRYINSLTAIPAADPSKFIVGNWYEEDRDFKIDMDYTKGTGSERFPIAIPVEPYQGLSEEEKEYDFKYPTYEQAGGDKKWDEMSELEKANYDLCKKLNALTVSINTAKRRQKEIDRLSSLLVHSEQKLRDSTRLLELAGMRIKELEFEYGRSRAILKELVNLKEIKDTLGKTDDYLNRQPYVWKTAKEFISNQSIER